MTKCPACRVPSQSVPGYIIKGDTITRCETCKGHGLVTEQQILSFDLH